MSAIFDVIVVGFGPAGATCANLLGAMGVRTLVIDKSRTVYEMPRAFALDHEIMRVFQNLGLAETIAPFTRPFTPSEYYGTEGQLIKRLGSVPPPYPLGWPPNMVFTQPPVEAALRQHATTHPCVTVALGEELVGLTQDDDHVTLELKSDTGASRKVASRYVIGCDGASSTVRTQSGLKYVDLEFDEPWLVVDLRVNDAGLAKLPSVSVQYCDPTRPATYLIGPDNHRRWEIMVLPGEDRREMEKEENVWRLLSRWITPDDAMLWRRASYQFHALVAGEWRCGRVFIAGDAAHQQPPFTGQGMCQGVRDVANLTWKLQAVLSGNAGDVLLDTYTIERREHVKRLTSIIKDIGRVICERNPEAARARDARLLAEAGGRVETQPRQELIPPIAAGLLSPTSHRANGTIFPQPRVKRGVETALLDELTGTGLRVVTNGTLDLAQLANDDTVTRLGIKLVQIAPDDRAALSMRPGGGFDVSLIETEGVLARWFERNQCAAALVRPDNYVYGVAATAADVSDQLAALACAYTPILIRVTEKS
ncbi:MAG: bifunctional 3-(3-hydroxy-phenyl)propionate/3-hydroxycinnamic acid hydroxylase [Casimicrobiaceae bacterium]